MHLKKFGYAAELNDQLFVNLADSQTVRITWSGVSGRIPTFRCQNAKIYHVQSNVWLTGRCKMAALGFPVTPGTALAMNVPIVPVSDMRRAAKIAGNSFHFSTAAFVQLVALASYKFME